MNENKGRLGFGVLEGGNSGVIHWTWTFRWSMNIICQELSLIRINREFLSWSYSLLVEVSCGVWKISFFSINWNLGANDLLLSLRWNWSESFTSARSQGFQRPDYRLLPFRPLNFTQLRLLSSASPLLSFHLSSLSSVLGLHRSFKPTSAERLRLSTIDSTREPSSLAQHV